MNDKHPAKWVVMNDLQIPFQDKPVLERLVLPFILKEVKPDGVVLNGDIVDLYQLSRFTKKRFRGVDLAREMDEAEALMSQFASVKRKVWNGGNHEQRLFDYVQNHAPEFTPLHEFTFPALFKLGKHGFEWREYGDPLRLGKLYVTHGDLIRKHAGQTGRETFGKYGVNMVIGHSHRFAHYAKRDMDGDHGVWENGCLCRLDPEYDPFPNWQQGFSIVHVLPSGLFHVEQIQVVNRRFFFYGGEMYSI